jgi:hypothetical protein
VESGLKEAQVWRGQADAVEGARERGRSPRLTDDIGAPERAQPSGVRQ